MLHSLRSRLIALLALALLPAGTLAVLQTVANYRQVVALTERNLLQSSAIVASEEKNEIVSARDALEQLAGLAAVASFVPGPCGEALLHMRDDSGRHYETLMALRMDGMVACSTNLPDTPNFADRQWFIRTLREADFTVTGNVSLPDNPTPHLLAALPLREADGRVSGVIAAVLPHSWLREILHREDGRSLANTSVALVDRHGDVMAESANGAASGDWMPAAFVIGAKLSGRAQVFQTAGRDGIERIFAMAPLYGQQVYIVLGGISGHLLTSPGWQLVAGLAYPVLMLAIVIIVAWIAVDRLVLRQVLSLRGTAGAYAEGRFEERTPGIDSAPQEIRELGTTMHKMADVISLHESELRKALEEQKALLREVYHRVKNNLQVVSSLVNLQVAGATNEDERTALRTTQDRIQALSMVHSNLYGAPELHRIALQTFIPQLCEYLRQVQGEAAQMINMTFDIDPVQSDPERAVPLALLVTEAVTNALKHAWPEGGSGRLDISLKRNGADDLVMIIDADGSVMESASPESLGGRLIHAFAKQLAGTVTIDGGDGFHLTLRMPAEQRPEIPAT